MSGTGLPDAGRTGPARWLAIGLAAAILLLIAYFRYASQAVIERGDGVQHYLYARWSWVHPGLLLEHWAKPLFTLLASPWAQLGHMGVAVFNLVVAFCTVLAATPVLRKAGARALIAYPLLLLSAPLYVEMLMAGMTEPLFGLLTVLCVSLLVRQRIAWAAVVASFMPFSRPEFIAFLPLLLLWLAFTRRWRSMPLLMVGSAIYGLVGWVVLDDPIWFITGDPYPNGPSRYGSGDPWMFTRQLDDVCGRPLMVLFIVALIAHLLPGRRSTDRGTDRLLLFLAALPAVLILGLHMVLWGAGIKASAGILRVVTTAVPLAALFASHGLQFADPRAIGLKVALPRWSGPVFMSVLALWCGIDLAQRGKLSVRPHTDEAALLRVCDRVRPWLSPTTKLHTTHPYLGFGLDLDPYDPERYGMTYGYSTLLERMAPGDLLFWDSELGPVESAISLDSLMSNDQLRLRLKEEPLSGHKVIHDVYYEMYVFERAPAHRSVLIDTLFPSRGNAGIRLELDTLAGGLRSWHMAPVLEAMTIEDVPRTPVDALFDELVITLSAEPAGGMGQQWILVYEQVRDGEILFRRQEELYGGAEEIHLRIVPMDSGTEHRFILRDPQQLGGTIKDLMIVRKRWTQTLPA